MNFYKEFFLITLEISFAIFLIIFGYAIWDNFDQTSYNTAKYYDNNQKFEILLEDNEELITFYEKENTIDYSKLYLHNISDKNNNTLLTFKINKNNTILKDNVIVKINENYYDINKLNYKEDEIYCYFIINNIEFKGYETKEYNIKLLLKNKINENINNYLNYEFATYA